jgi:hypothetical protein
VDLVPGFHQSQYSFIFRAHFKLTHLHGNSANLGAV